MVPDVPGLLDSGTLVEPPPDPGTYCCHYQIMLDKNL